MPDASSEIPFHNRKELVLQTPSAAPRNCYMCGRTDKPLTKDHVIPKVLFPRPRPHNLITEDACEACNNSFSKDDEMFALYLSAALGRNSAGAWVWANAIVARTLPRSRPLATKVLADMTKAKILTELGLADVDILRIPQDRLERVLFRIAKGLVRHLQPVINPVALKFASERLWPTSETANVIQDARQKMMYMELGNGVFRCLYAFTPEIPRHVMFFFIFYDAVGFVVTGQPSV